MGEGGRLFDDLTLRWPANRPGDIHIARTAAQRGQDHHRAHGLRSHTHRPCSRQHRVRDFLHGCSLVQVQERLRHRKGLPPLIAVAAPVRADDLSELVGIDLNCVRIPRPILLSPLEETVAVLKLNRHTAADANDDPRLHGVMLGEVVAVGRHERMFAQGAQSALRHRYNQYHQLGVSLCTSGRASAPFRITLHRVPSNPEN
jgi:hypothetical protein